MVKEENTQDHIKKVDLALDKEERKELKKLLSKANLKKRFKESNLFQTLKRLKLKKMKMNH